jgi:CheY-like chemotaxis protein
MALRDGGGVRNGEKVGWQGRLVPGALIVFAVLVSAVVVASIFDGVVSGTFSQVNVEALSGLIKALIWPITLLCALTLFDVPIKELLSRLTKLTAKLGGNEVTLETTKAIAEATYNLGAAKATSTAANQAATDDAEVTVNPLTSMSLLDSSQSGYAYLTRLGEGKVLWVDDRPANNRYLARAFEALGIRVVNALSTDEAIKALSLGKFDVIISDMGRPPDATAGYTLLREIQKLGIFAPTIIYAGSNSEEHRRMAKAAGAIESTNDPQRVFDLVTRIISEKAPQVRKGL